MLMQENNNLGSEEELTIVVKCSEDRLRYCFEDVSYCTENIQIWADAEISTKLC